MSVSRQANPGAPEFALAISAFFIVALLRRRVLVLSRVCEFEDPQALQSEWLA